MPNYVYNIVYRRGDASHVYRNTEPQTFPGSATEFARTTLVAWLAENREHADEIAVVSVWDADLPSVGDPRTIIGWMSNRDLDQGPFDANQIHVPYGHYHILSAGYEEFGDDAILGDEGTDNIHGTPYGLIVPGEGPALRIRAGHEGWIGLDVTLHDSAPPADVDQWEAIEQATIRPMGEVRIADHAEAIQSHYPDLTGGNEIDYLAIRVSVRGRDLPDSRPGARHPRRAPVERHLIEAWPTGASEPPTVLKRDNFSRD